MNIDVKKISLKIERRNIMVWHDKLNIETYDDIRWRMSNLEKKIRDANIEIVQATKHRDSLKREFKEAKRKIDPSN